MREKIKHYEYSYVNTRQSCTKEHKHVPSSPELSSRIRADPPDLRYLQHRPMNQFSQSAQQTHVLEGTPPREWHEKKTDLERDVVVADANLEFLLAHDVLLGPVSVIFSVTDFSFRHGPHDGQGTLTW